MYRDGVRQELSPPDAFTLEGEEAGQMAEGIKRRAGEEIVQEKTWKLAWGKPPAYDPLIRPPMPGASVLQASRATQRLCSSSMGVALKSFEPTVWGAVPPLPLSHHQPGVLSPASMPHVFLFSCSSLSLPFSH